MGRGRPTAAHAGTAGDGPEPPPRALGRDRAPGIWGPLAVFVVLQLGSIVVRVALGERKAMLVLWVIAVAAFAAFVVYEVRRPTPAERAQRSAERAPARSGHPT